MAFIRRLHAVSNSIFSFSISSKIMAKNTQARRMGVALRNISTSQLLHETEEVKVIFINVDGDKIEAKGKVGESMMQIALKNSIFIPDYLCDGDMNCDCCNFMFRQKDYDRLPEPNHSEVIYLNRSQYPNWSRMGCQIKMTKNLSQIEVQVPELPLSYRSKPNDFYRSISTSQKSSKSFQKMNEIKIIFINANEDEIETKGKLGDSIMDIALKNSIFKPIGFCDGLMLCYACHFIFTKEDYDRLPEPIYFEADDFFTETSRSGCQIKMTQDFDGIKIRVPPPTSTNKMQLVEVVSVKFCFYSQKKYYYESIEEK